MPVVLPGFHEQELVGGRPDACPVPLAIRNWQYCKNRPSIEDIKAYIGYDITENPVPVVRDAAGSCPWVWVIEWDCWMLMHRDEARQRMVLQEYIATLRRKILTTPTIYGRAAVELFLTNNLEICDGAFIPRGETYQSCAAILIKMLREVAANNVAVRWRDVRDQRLETAGVVVNEAYVSVLRDARRPDLPTVLTSFVPPMEFLEGAFRASAGIPDISEACNPSRYTLASSERLSAVSIPTILFAERKAIWNAREAKVIAFGMDVKSCQYSIYCFKSESARLIYFGVTSDDISVRFRRSHHEWLALQRGRDFCKFNRSFHVVKHADCTHAVIAVDNLPFTEALRKKLVEYLAQHNVPEGWQCANLMPEVEKSARPTDTTVRKFIIYRIVETVPEDPLRPRCYVGMTGTKLSKRMENHHNILNGSTAKILIERPYRTEVLLEQEMTRLEALRHEAAFIHMYRDTAINKSDPRMEQTDAIDEETRNAIVARREELKQLTGIRERRTRLADDPSFMETMAEAAGAGAGSAAEAGEAGVSEDEDDGYVDEDMRQEDEEDETGENEDEELGDEDEDEDDVPSPAKQSRVQ
jgi:hypothetical protein